MVPPSQRTIPPRTATGTLSHIRAALAAAGPGCPPGNVAERLLAVVLEEVPGSSGGALVLMHPQTGLFWTGAVTSLPVETCHPFFEVELEESPHCFRRMASASSGARALSLRAPGDALAERVLGPFGYTDEVRTVCRDAGLVWAGLSLWRKQGRFTADDERFLDEVADGIGAALRDAVLASLDVAGPDRERGGVLVLEDGRVMESSPMAAALLEQNQQDPEEYRHLDHLVALARTDPRFSTVLNTKDGHWTVAHGSELGPGRVAVLLSSATPADLLGPRVAGAGLTPREIEVTRLLCRGLSEAEIARALGISAHTAHDHVRSIRRKLGLRSRSAITALVFADAYFDDFLESASASHAAPG